jgi:hypothetical protein
MAKPGTLDLAAARMLAGTPPDCDELESLWSGFEEAHAARAATEVTRSRVFSVFIVWLVGCGKIFRKEGRRGRIHGRGRAYPIPAELTQFIKGSLKKI